MTDIVHLGKYYAPDAGGIESVTLSLARGAAAAGHTVTVVCFEKSRARREEVMEGVRVLRAPITKLLASQPLGLRYFFLCLKAARQADVIHLHLPNMLAALCILFIGKKPRLLVHWHSDVVNKGILGALLRPLVDAVLRRSDCIVATSEVYANASSTLKPHRAKITVVPIGVADPKRMDAQQSLPQEIEDRVGGRKIILAVGRLVPYKGFHWLVAAAKDLAADVVIVIVGGGPLHSALGEAIASAGMAERVVMTGRLSDQALQALFERASLYCLPSTDRAEAFGVVLLEAMAYGLPIVASDIPGSGVPWVNQHGVSGLNVTVGDPAALAAACNRILDSAELHATLSAGARQRFMSEFTEEVSVQRIMAAYRRMVAG
jgi:glycosyltransferase involved in cell wall biosynthesis